MSQSAEGITGEVHPALYGKSFTDGATIWLFDKITEIQGYFPIQNV